jgi:peptidyl-prolyl cis-trans isomerase SurA
MFLPDRSPGPAKLSYRFTQMRPSFTVLAIAVCGFGLTACQKSPPANVAATVNGRPITYADVDKHFLLQSAGAQERPGEDQVTIQKLEILRALIEQEIMLQRAEKISLIATDADVDAKLNELKSGYTEEEFQRQLTSRKMTRDDLRAQIRRDLSVNKLMNKEITSHISISDKEITEAYNASRASFNIPEPQIHLAQIVVTPGADPVTNLKNDNATSEDAAVKKIQALEARVRQGEDFSLIAQNFSEDQSAASGGDLGFLAESSLEKDPELRKYISQLGPGQISRTLRMGGTFRLLKVISREAAGQRELNDPSVQQRIRETLMNRKDQLLRTAYYEVARNEAKVNNYFAQSIAQNKTGKK